MAKVQANEPKKKRGNPNIAAIGVQYRFKPGPDPRRKGNGVKQEVSTNMDNALGVALTEALDIIINPRNQYYAEHRVHMIEVVIKYCAPRRKEIDLDASGGLLGFDPTKFFSPDTKPEPAVEVEFSEAKGAKQAVPVKAKLNGSNGNGNGRYEDEADDD